MYNTFFLWLISYNRKIDLLSRPKAYFAIFVYWKKERKKITKKRRRRKKFFKKNLMVVSDSKPWNSMPCLQFIKQKIQTLRNVFVILGHSFINMTLSSSFRTEKNVMIVILWLSICNNFTTDVTVPLVIYIILSINR